MEESKLTQTVIFFSVLVATAYVADAIKRYFGSEYRLPANEYGVFAERAEEGSEPRYA